MRLNSDYIRRIVNESISLILEGDDILSDIGREIGVYGAYIYSGDADRFRIVYECDRYPTVNPYSVNSGISKIVYGYGYHCSPVFYGGNLVIDCWK